MAEDKRKTLGNSSEDRARRAIPDKGDVHATPGRPLSELFGMLAYDGPPVTLEDMDRAIAEGAYDD
ncbi:MAG: hypothetical protein F4Y03_11245 [Alphaproteobacteria bacterium]|nr:hypothetical protein [Alphaproteobacteria bacterium]MYE01831.1 hypothetical protein [Alphaproteobacteria bacterium]